VIKRIGLLIMVALVAAMMMVATAAPAFAAQPTCPGHPGCKTTDDPNKNNDKFMVTRLGSGEGAGTDSGLRK
jgi:hypothetical protein